MLAANIWHWWIGVIMAVAGFVAVISLTIGYLKQVTHQRYPSGRRAKRALTATWRLDESPAPVLLDDAARALHVSTSRIDGGVRVLGRA